MPMNPEWLPVMAVLLAGICAAFLSLRSLFFRRFRRALALGAAAIAMIAGAFALGYTPQEPIRPLIPGTPLTTNPDTTTMRLVLGTVSLRVPLSDHYILTFEGRRFLMLETNRKGLLVSCDAGSPKDGIVLHIRGNRFVYPSWPLGHENRPDPQTFAVQNEHKVDVFRVCYCGRQWIEVIGTLYTADRRDTVEFRDFRTVNENGTVGGGIRWPGGGVPPGTMIDLRPMGKGTIDFERSGAISVRR